MAVNDQCVYELKHAGGLGSRRIAITKLDGLADLLSVVMDKLLYIDAQEPSEWNKIALLSLRSALFALGHSVETGARPGRDDAQGT